jgi:lysophospholipase L1-like esterase
MCHTLTCWAAWLPLALAGATASRAADPSPLAGVHRVVFLGDSITYSGQYIEFIEAYLRLKDPGLRCEFLNLGLPSETVSGLSEPGHADGAFPRPELRERLDRVLAKSKPDLIVACYGMNDGIYYPFGADRFEKFQAGMRFLREQAAAAGAKVLHVTPPVFDPLPIQSRTLPAGRDEYRQPYEGYDEVLDRYSAWLLDQRARGWDVVDVHGPMKRHIAAHRERDPGYYLAGDGVHANDVGHWIIAREILLHWGAPAREIAGADSVEKVLGASADPHGMDVLELVRQRQRLLKDAWLTATGHKRPGMKAGLPLEDAERRSREIEEKLRALLDSAPR